ncbi:MAG TPA: hypothetical protein VGC29_04495 [Flavisolibacter sp.]
MKRKLHITTSFDQPELLQNMVEKLAYRRTDGNNQHKRLGEWQMVDTSGIEKYVSGTVELSFSKKQKIKIPFITRFIFSCTKNSNNPYRMNWCMSLS